MSHRTKAWIWIGGSAGLLFAILLLIGVEVIRSPWFASYVSRKIVSVAEVSTGGRAELGTFAFDWKNRRARVTGFVLHGKEPSGSPPLLRVDAIELRLKLLPSWKNTVDLEYLGIERPAANILVFPDGTTNIPQPKVPSNTRALQTIVDLAIHKFDLTGGSLTFAEQNIPLAAHGQDFRAQLSFDMAASVYRGDVSFESVLWHQGRPPLKASIRVPITIGKDRVETDKAMIATAASSLSVSGSLINPQHPIVEAHVVAHLSLDDVHKATGIAGGACVKGRPCFADADFEGRIDEQRFAVSKASLSMGRSHLDGSGTRDSIYLVGNLAMQEVCQIFQFGGESIGDVRLAGLVKSEQDRIEVQELRIDVLGGEFTIDGSLEHYNRFQIRSKIGRFQLAGLERRFLSAKPGSVGGYEGTLAGDLVASGDLTRPGTSGIRAQTRLDVVPAKSGVPVKGRIDADYDGASNVVKIARGSIVLPHSLLTLSGILGSHLEADFTTSDTRDLYPAVAMALKDPPREIPLALNGGTLQLHARADGPLASPSIRGHVNADQFIYEKRGFDHLSADVTASQNGFAILDGSLSRGALQASFSGWAGLRNWTLTSDQPVKAAAQLHNAALPDLLALAGESSIPAAGQLNASIDANGTVGNPMGTISVFAANGNLYGEPFQTVELQAAMSDQLIRLTRADWIGPAGSLHANGTYTHSRDNLLAGDFSVNAASNSVRLNAVANVAKLHAGIDGTLQLNMNASASVRRENGHTEFAVTSLRGDVRADNVHDQTKSYGNLSAHADTSRSMVSFRADSNLSGAVIRVSGQTTLAKDYPTTADVSIQNLAIENLPFELGVPVKGTVALNGHAQGTLGDPVVTAQLNLVHGNVYGEPIDRLEASGRYTAQLVEISSLQVNAPAGGGTLTGSYVHPSNRFDSGAIQIQVTTGDLHLGQMRSLQNAAPGLGGGLKVSMDLAGDLRTIDGEPKLTPTKVDASASLTKLTCKGRPAGDAKLAAKSSGGAVTFGLDSDIAHATIHAQGEAKLTGDYPITGQFSAHDLRFSNLKPFLNVESITSNLEASAELEGSISGSARTFQQLRADIRIPSFEANSSRGTGGSKVAMTLENQGPIEMQLDRSVLTVRSAHIVGSRGTDIAVAGTVGLAEKNPLNLTIKANGDLGILQDIDHDFYSSGSVFLDAFVRGSFSAPLATGSLQLKSASINMAGFSNGISNANGTILLNGSSATIRDLTGESGGGKITLSGFAAYTGSTLRYSLRANANRVRTRRQGVSIVNNAALTLSGTSQRGLISGTVTVVSVGINPQSDLGSILSAALATQADSELVSPFLSNTRLDIRIRTAPGVRFQSTLAHDLKAEADLNLVGTLSDPGMTGRVVVTEGNLIFFGNEYTVNHGVIFFYNPLRIEPQLNVSLETTVQSINVVLTLTGRIDNLKLSYRSDPPIQFEEIVALLAIGRRPSSDPTIVANETPQPQQSVGQMGETAVVSQAIASPVSSRMERVFGVTQLKIDPTFASGSALPQASLTLQQRVANTVTFTYTQDYSQPNSELVRVEWALSPRFSAVATRDINGIFGVDFFYKRQFR